MNHSILHNQFYVQYFKKQSLNNFNKIYSLLNKKDFFHKVSGINTVQEAEKSWLILQS